MDFMEELKEKLMKELEEMSEKEKLTVGDVDALNKVSATIKNLFKIEMFDEESGYSSAGGGSYGRGGSYGGGSYRGGSYRGGNSSAGGSYNDGGNSYARRGQRYVRGYYRDGGSYGEGESMAGYRSNRGYSRAEAKESMMSQLGMMLEDASSNKEREAIERCMKQIENA